MESRSITPTWKQSIFAIILMALVYFSVGQLVFSISAGTVSNVIVTLVVFLSEGFALAGVLLFGRRLWVGIFIGQLLLALHSGLPVTPAIGISFVNSLEAILAVMLFNHFHFNRSLSRIRDVVGLLVLITFFLQPFSAILGNIILLEYVNSSFQNFWLSIFSWWFGNLLGQFLITPMILLLYANRKQLDYRFLLLTGLASLLLMYLILVFFSIDSLAIISSITLPLVLLLASFTNITYSAVSTTIISLFATYATGNGIGAFATGGGINDVINLNFYILIHVLLVLIIGTLFAERKRSEQKLLQQNKDLKDMMHLKEQVEQMNRHDLKNQLNVVINAPPVILDIEEGLSATTVRLLDACQSAGHMILEMVNRSLDIYKIETGHYQLMPEELDLHNLLTNVTHELNIGTSNTDEEPESIQLTLYQPENSGNMPVLGESLLCYSLFANLIKNALEASPPGFPVLVQMNYDLKKKQCVVDISNEGSVPEDIQDIFFEKLVSRNKKSGTGIGTYSARLFTQIQNGSISLDCSEENRTRVSVRLPLV
jgi:signal transduction histidine kinase